MDVIYIVLKIYILFVDVFRNYKCTDGKRKEQTKLYCTTQ